MCARLLVVLTFTFSAVQATFAEAVDALTIVERNRPRIVSGMALDHANALSRSGIGVEAFMTALWALPPQELLMASLSNTFEGVSTIVARFNSGRVEEKDGAGNGAGSWIGYTAGDNVANASGSAVAAGRFNASTGQNAFVGAGQSNVASGISSLVIGGFDNQASGIDSLIGAGAGNRATGARAVVAGGGYNLAAGQWSFIGGGGREHGGGEAGSQVEDNVASGKWSTIGGGAGNLAGTSATHQAATIAGGLYNMATEFGATVAGGQANAAFGQFSAVGGGNANSATGNFSSVTGGTSNAANGAGSVVVGGGYNIAGANWTVAMGVQAIADEVGCAVFSFWSPPSLPFNCRGTSNVVRVGADHGLSVDYFTNHAPGGGSRSVSIGDLAESQTISTWTGAYLSDSGVWTNASDRDLKEDFATIDAAAVLARVMSLPVQRWRYKRDQLGVTHIGPTAQDFRSAFGLGNDDKTIGTVDIDGVALAAIQGLKRESDEKTARIQELERRLDELERALNGVVRRSQL